MSHLAAGEEERNLRININVSYPKIRYELNIYMSSRVNKTKNLNNTFGMQVGIRR